MEPNETSAGIPSEQNDATVQNEGNMMPETPSVDAAVGAEAIVASEEIAESGKTLKDDTVGGMMAGGAEPKKNGKGMLIGMILFALLAVGGIGFGVWAMMDGNNQKDELEKDYKNKISILEQQNEKLTEKLSEANKNDGDVIINVDTDENVNPEDYIYVGEWGLKIKIPENLDMVSYKLKQDNNGSSLAVSGIRGYDGRLPSFANIDSRDIGLGVVSRILTGQDDVSPCGPNKPVFSDNDYSYCYSHPQDVISVGDEEIGLEVESTKLVTEMLSNSENYSAI